MNGRNFLKFPHFEFLGRGSDFAWNDGRFSNFDSPTILISRKIGVLAENYVISTLRRFYVNSNFRKLIQFYPTYCRWGSNLLQRVCEKHPQHWRFLGLNRTFEKEFCWWHRFWRLQNCSRYYQMDPDLASFGKSCTHPSNVLAREVPRNASNFRQCPRLWRKRFCWEKGRLDLGKKSFLVNQSIFHVIFYSDFK